MPRSTRATAAGLRRLLLLLSAAGCTASKPVRVQMEGDICAAGTIKTVLAADNNARPVRARTLPRQPRCGPKIALVDVDGLLLNRNLTGGSSLGENPVALFREKLEAAAADPGVCALVLRVNSPGGGVTASDIMRRDLERFRQSTGKPVVACLMDLGAGGAYYLATQSDLIIAHPTTLTGGLGVLLNLYQMEDTLSQQNIFPETIRSGAKTDMGSPIRQVTVDERAILERVAGDYHQRLRRAVGAARPNLRTRVAGPLPPPGDEAPTLSPADSAPLGEGPDPLDGTIYDGRVLLAREAVELGLVDRLGYVDDALAAAREIAGLAVARTIVYRRSNDRALTAYDITPNLPTPTVSLPLSIPGLDRSQLPIFLYMWQPEPAMERTGGA